MKPFLPLLLSLFAVSTAPLAYAAEDIAVEGRDATLGTWPNIDDADLNPDQVVTDFDNVDTGSSRARTFRVRNTGNSTLTINSIVSDDSRFTISGLSAGTNVGQNATNEFTITFAPTSLGSQQAIITIRSSDPDGEDPYTFAVEGTGTGPEVNVYGNTTGSGTYYSIADADTTPESTNGTHFGTITAGTTRTRYFKVYNSGNQALNVQVPSFSGSGASSFSVHSLTSSVNLAAENTRLFEIRFSPATAGTKTATFSMGTNDANENPFNFTITGVATGTPDITVEGNDSLGWPNINDGDLTANQVVTNFGNVAMGSFGSRFYRIRNTGTDTLTVTASTSSSGQFSFDGLAIPRSISPGAEEVFDIVYTPTTYGETTAVITLTSNDPDSENSYTFAVKGSGLGAEIAIGGGIASSGPFTSLTDGDTSPTVGEGTDFGSVAIGSAVRRYFRITNSGSDGLNVQAPVLTGTGGGHFVVNGINSAFNIGAGSTRDFEIEFIPTTPGTKTATFSLSSNDADESPYTFSLTGLSIGFPSIIVEGTDGVTWPNIDDGDLDAEQGVTNFGNVNLNTSESRTFRVRNEGTATLNITGVTSSNSHYTVAGLAAGNTVAAGGERVFTVNFIPTAESTVQTVISIQSNASGGLATYTFALTGTGKGPEIVVETTSYFYSNSRDEWVENLREIAINDFTPTDAEGTTCVDSQGNTTFGTGTTFTKYIKITNIGNDGLDINVPFLAGPDAAHFSISSISGLTNIAPGNDRWFHVNYQPQSPGTHQVQVIIPSNDGDEGLYSFDIRGSASDQPEIELQQFDGILWSDAGSADVEFFNVDTGDSHDRRLRLKNKGRAAAVIAFEGIEDSQFTVIGLPQPLTLAPDAEEEFTVRYAPTSFGLSTAYLLLGGSAGGQPTPVPNATLTGIGRGSSILVEGLGNDGNYYEIADGDTTQSATDGTDFGSYDIGGGKLDHTFKITNLGNQALSISNGRLTGTNADQFDISSLQTLLFNVSIAPGNSQTFTLSFDPTSAGTKTATMTLENNDPLTGPFNFRIKGTGFGFPEIEVKGHSGGLDPYNDIADGSTVTRNTDGTDFGVVAAANASKSRVFKIKNTGNVPLWLESVTENSPQFSITGITNSLGLPAGGETEFTVTYDPSAYGNHTAVITIDNTDADEGDFTFTVSGTGSAAEIEVRGGAGMNTVIVDGDITASTADHTDFGIVDITNASLSRSFSIRNLGNEPLYITDASSSNGIFSITSLDLTVTIPAGQSHTFQLTFDPITEGDKYAFISLTSNDPDESPYTFRVHGYGGSGQPEIQVEGDNSTEFTAGQTNVTTAAGTDFGSVTAGTGMVSRTFTIVNAGSATLSISSLTDNAPAFTLGTVPASIPALTSATFVVTYQPVIAATHNAVISINSNDADEPMFTFAIRGTGVAAPPPARPEISILGGDSFSEPIGAGDTTPSVAAGTDLESVEIGTSVTKTFRIRNTGEATLTISSASFLSAPRFTLQGVAASIPPGSSDDFTVTYTPTNEGSTSRVLTITSDDQNEGSYAITFTATAVAPPGQLAVTSIQPAGNKVILTFVSVPNRTYRILRSDDLQNWIPASGFSSLAGDFAPQSYTLPQGPNGQRFWRVEQE